MMTFPAEDPVLIISIVMFAVLVAPILAEKLRLPGIVGLIFFGIILGPHVTNILERDQTIELLGTIGLLYIMFQAGLEINLEEVRKNKHHSIIFGLLTFAIPLIMGTASGMTILAMTFSASVLLASMFSSHTLLTYPIVSRMGLGKHKAVAATIGATIITDTLALLVLAVVVAAHAGDLGATFWVKLVVFSVIYTVIVTKLLPKLTRWFFQHFFSDSGVEEYVFIMTALFICAYFSHVIGLEPIIGAFLAGITLNPLIPEKSVMMSRIHFVGDSLFIPFFLISVGMLIDPFVLFTNVGAIRVTVVMVVVALVSKEIASRLFSKIASFDKIERGLMYGMSVNQAAATLAAVIVGYRVGIFQEDVLAGTIMMIIVTTIVGSIITQKYTKKLALSTQDVRDYTSKHSLERVLVPIAKHDNVNGLMDLAMLLQDRQSHEPLYPLNIVTDSTDVERKIIEGESILTKASIRASSMQKNAIPLSKIDVSTTSALVSAVHEHRISKVVLGWSKKTSLHGSFFENLTELFVKNSHEMILISDITQPINLTKRIVLIIPPFMYRQNGFIDTINSLKKFASSISAEWLIVSEQETYEAIKHHFAKVKKDVHHKTVKSWKSIAQEMTSVVEEDDLIMQMISRRGKLAWRLDFERIPNRLRDLFPNNNLILVYPFFKTSDESVEYDEDEEERLDLKSLELIPGDHYYLDVKDKEPEKILRRIADEKFPEYKEAIYKKTIEVLEDYPVELTNEVVLIHTRTYFVEDHEMFIAVNREGFEFSKLDKPHKIIIVLLSSEDKSNQSHLNVLSQISRFITRDFFNECILDANDFEQYEMLCKTKIATP